MRPLSRVPRAVARLIPSASPRADSPLRNPEVGPARRKSRKLDVVRPTRIPPRGPARSRIVVIEVGDGDGSAGPARSKLGVPEVKKSRPRRVARQPDSQRHPCPRRGPMTRTCRGCGCGAGSSSSARPTIAFLSIMLARRRRSERRIHEHERTASCRRPTRSSGGSSGTCSSLWLGPVVTRGGDEPADSRTRSCRSRRSSRPAPGTD